MNRISLDSSKTDVPKMPFNFETHMEFIVRDASEYFMFKSWVRNATVFSNSSVYTLSTIIY